MNAEADVARQRAAQDIEHIRAIRNHPAWGAWYMRRMKQKIESEAAVMKRGVTLDERELARQRLLLLEEIAGMPEADESACRRILGE